MHSEQQLDYAYNLLNDFLNTIEKVSLKERININKYGTASIEVDSKITSLTVDAKKTISLAKNLYKQITSTKRQAVTERFLKYFRLISENSRKVIAKMARLLSDSAWLENIPNTITKKGVQAIEYFRQSINSVLNELNDKINILNDKITMIPKVEWKFVKTTPEQKYQMQQRIKYRNFSLFESIYANSR
jgi:hypothetical protein